MTDVPGYRLEVEIGTGGMSTVYRATRIADGAPVAVKVLNNHLLVSDQGYLRRLRTEAELAARVEHDGVVAVHEVGGDDESAWLVMDLVHGPDLQRLVDERGPLPAGHAAEIMATVADAVSAVHAAGLVHRDLKPANILLEGDRPVIADFGVARPVATVESSLGIGLTGGTDWAHTDTGREPGDLPRAGTVAYMAPEQWRGESGHVLTDVYALGGTLYTALTARRPFPQRSLPELAFAVAISAPPAPSAHGAPAAFDPVVATAMAKDPAERYPDAATFAEAVRAAAAGRTLPAARPNHSAGPRRRRMWIAGGAAALLLGVAGGLVIWRPGAEPDTVERIVCARDITVRTEPRSRFVLATLRRDERIRVYHNSPEPGWAQTDLPDGRRGWVLTQYLGPPC